MRAAALTAAALLAAGTANGTNNNTPDSYCQKLAATSDTTAWTIDPGLPAVLTDVVTRLNAYTYDDVRNIADQHLQNIVRHSRARVRMRMVGGSPTCSWGSQSCFTSRSDAQHAECQNGAQAVASNFLFGAAAVAWCSTNRTDTLSPANLDELVAHELGHVYGLTHPSGPSDSEAPPANCAALNVARAGCDGVSDECEGETMCGKLGCFASPHLAAGDMNGLRRKYTGTTGYGERRLWWGMDPLPGVNLPALQVPAVAMTTAFPPRIDCAKSATPSGPYSCVTVITRVVNGAMNISLVGLSGWTPTGWSTAVLVGNYPVNIIMPPDVAMNTSGTYAWIVGVDSAWSSYARRVNLLDGTTSSIIYLGSHDVLPPRVSFYSDTGLPYIANVRTADWLLGTDPPNDFPALEARMVSLFSDLPFDVGGLQLPAANDFDFDCRRLTGGVDKCVQVNLQRTDEVQTGADELWSRSFSISSGGGVVYDGPKVDGAYTANAVIGVALSDAALFVNSGRRIMDGTTTANTRVSEYSQLSVSGAAASTSTHPSDADTCSTGSSWGYTIPAATMHGGYSIAWCQGCGATGALVSAHMGRRSDGDTFCF
ncbi:MAG: hypothetical protein IT382_11225 [Deltaproteobacteria bacterium]|nr:hypothetical protein [Deltaproteobacteria bacterium]